MWDEGKVFFIASEREDQRKIVNQVLALENLILFQDLIRVYIKREEGILSGQIDISQNKISIIFLV